MKTNQGLPYGINFDTSEMKNKIVYTRVDLYRDYLGIQDSVNVALCEHPLYDHLYNYCIANPPAKKSK